MADKKHVEQEQGSEAVTHWEEGQQKLAKGDVIGASLAEFKALDAVNKHMQGPEAASYWKAGQKHLNEGHLIDASIDEIKALSAAASHLTNTEKKR